MWFGQDRIIIMKNQEKIMASLTLIANRNLGIETLENKVPVAWLMI